MSQQLWGTPAQQVNYELLFFVLFSSGWMMKCSGARWVSHDFFFFFFFFLPGWMGRCSGAWWVYHEFFFYQGEWGGAVKNDESTMRGFIRVNGEEQWNMATAEIPEQATVEKYWIRQQWKSTGSGNSGKVPDLSTLKSHSFRDTGSSPPKKVSMPAKIKRCKLQAP